MLSRKQLELFKAWAFFLMGLVILVFGWHIMVLQDRVEILEYRMEATAQFIETWLQ